MRFLFISLWYTPEPVFKPHDFARELVKRGHQVTVITGYPNYPTGQLFAGYRVRLWQSEVIDGVRVIRIPHLIDRSQSAVRRICSYVSFGLVTIFAGTCLACKPDIIWTYQIGFPGAILSLFKRKPLVHEVQDLWPEWGQAISSGLKGWLYKILEAQEKFIYGVATAIVTISDGFHQALIAKGVAQQKITVLANWANEENFQPVLPDPVLAEREGLGQRFCVMYVGNIGAAQALDTVVQTAALLQEVLDTEYVLVGDGVARETLERQVKEQGLTNIRFLGSRPQEQAAAYLAWADVALIHLKQDPAYEITIPSKAYAYLAVGKPIIAAASGDTARLIEESGAGLVCRPGDPSALAQTVRQFFALPLSERVAMGQAGRKAFLSSYTRQVLVDKYEELFRKISSSDSTT